MLQMKKAINQLHLPIDQVEAPGFISFHHFTHWSISPHSKHMPHGYD